MEIHTDEGLTGIGESDVNPWIARACIRRRARTPWVSGWRRCSSARTRSTSRRLWEKLYVGSAMNGRRGAVINAMGALDMALHDSARQGAREALPRAARRRRARDGHPVRVAAAGGELVSTAYRGRSSTGRCGRKSAGLPGGEDRGDARRARTPTRACAAWHEGMTAGDRRSPRRQSDRTSR